MGDNTNILRRCCLISLITIFLCLPFILQSNPALSVADIKDQKRAYATYFSGSEDESRNEHHFTAVRVLAYQLLHHPTTRSNMDVPFLVLVSPQISEEKRRTLLNDGALVIPIEPLEPRNSWARPLFSRWGHHFSKLRLFQMVEYDRILYLESETILTQSLDRIWDETVSQNIQTTRSNISAILKDEAPLPETYLLTGSSDISKDDHASHKQLNSGFWMIRPDITLFQYYQSIMEIGDRFDSTFMERSLLSYAHRPEGNMPWASFTSRKWNTNQPKDEDVDGKCATLLEKLWCADNACWINRKMIELWWKRQGQMEGFWQAKKE